MVRQPDGAKCPAAKAEIAWELLKMVCLQMEQTYVEQGSRVREIVNAYKQAQQAPEPGQQIPPQQ